MKQLKIVFLWFIAGIAFLPLPRPVAAWDEARQHALAPNISWEPQRRMYQRALLLEILEATRQRGIVHGLLPADFVRSVQGRFEMQTLGDLSEEFRHDFATHPLWPETVYLRPNGHVVGWFEEVGGAEPAIVEAPAQNGLGFYVWPDARAFLQDIAVHEGPAQRQVLVEALAQNARTESERTDALRALRDAMTTVLETYSNVHRGQGQFSLASTELLEEARKITERFFGIDTEKWMVVFGNDRNLLSLLDHAESHPSLMIASEDLGLPLGIGAIAVRKDSLAMGPPPNPAGGTVKYALQSVVNWASGPDKFEAGTPNIVGIILFAKALQLSQGHRDGSVFQKASKSILLPRHIPGLFTEDALKGYRDEALLEHLAETLVGRGLQVPTRDGRYPYINFDNGASTPTYQPIADVAQTLLSSRIPPATRLAIVEEAEKILRRFLHAPKGKHDVLFTGNTSDASNILLQSVHNEARAGGEKGERMVVLGSDLEHNSNRLPYQFAAAVEYIRLPIDKQGIFDEKKFRTMLDDYNFMHKHGPQRIRLVAVSGASNTLGTINDIKRMILIAHEYGARVVVDAAQLVAHRPVDMQDMGADYLIFSAHKMYAPFGSGALVAKRGLLRFTPHELAVIRQSGQVNLIGIATMAKAMELLMRVGMDVVARHEQEMLMHAMTGLKSLGDGEIEVYGITRPEHLEQRTGVITFNLKKWPRNFVAMWLALDRAIGTRQGCFCATMSVTQTLGFDEKYLNGLADATAIDQTGPGMVRVSFGLYNTKDQIDALVASLKRLVALDADPFARSLAANYSAIPLIGSGTLPENIASAYARLRGVAPSEIRQSHVEFSQRGLVPPTDEVEAFVAERMERVYGLGRLDPLPGNTRLERIIEGLKNFQLSL